MMLVKSEFIVTENQGQRNREQGESIELPKIEIMSIEEGDRVSCKQASTEAGRFLLHVQC